MKNKPKPNIFNQGNPNRLESQNTMYYNVITVIRWDTRKAETNFKKHKVSFEEAATVLFSDRSIEIEDLRHSEQRFIIIGFSSFTRLLAVVYAHKYEDEIRIISARKATKNEAEKYEERI
ncbi:BrnT family toxin [Bdellovibrio sp.]|uniref:BrnT family toxin n=1 Tax=Bdellovibrio sp. TaxID=28201 RepID=UPI0039E335CC